MPGLVRSTSHPYGQKVILLLGGYDKAKDPSPSRQQREIKTARGQLADFHEQQRVLKKLKPLAAKKLRRR